MAIQRGKCLSVGGRLPGRSYEVDWTLEDTCFEKESAVTIASTGGRFLRDEGKGYCCSPVT